MLYRVGYIDDETRNIRDFKIEARGNFTVVQIELKPDLDEVVHDILSSDLDALIVDHTLNTSNPKIHYNGVNIVEKIDEKILDFPVIILTAYEEEAESFHISANRIYDKEVSNSNTERFIRKIKQQIETRKYKIKEAEKELSELSKKDNLSIIEEERIIELDEYLEKSMSRNKKIPKSLKKSTNEEKLLKLIQLAEKTLEEVKYDEK